MSELGLYALLVALLGALWWVIADATLIGFLKAMIGWVVT